MSTWQMSTQQVSAHHAAGRSSLPPPPRRPEEPAPAGSPRWAAPDAGRATGPAPRDDSHAERTSSVGPAAEFLGYVGGIVTTLAAVYLAADWWDGLGGAGQVIVLLAGTIALGVAAAVVGDEDAVADRLSTTLWWLTSATALATTYLLVDRVALLGDDAALLASGLTGLAVAGYQWRQRGGVALHLPTYASAVVSMAGAAKVVSPEPELLAAAVWVIGAVWITLTLAGVVGERRTGLALGAVTTLGATQAVVADATDAGLVLAIVTTAVLAALAFTRREWLLGGFAGLAALVFLPQIYDQWLADVLTGTLVALFAGIAMLGGCIASIVVARRRLAADQQGGSAHG